MTDAALNLDDLRKAPNPTPKKTDKLPVGVGLTVSAIASLSLWTVIGFGLRAVLA